MSRKKEDSNRDNRFEPEKKNRLKKVSEGQKPGGEFPWRKTGRTLLIWLVLIILSVYVFQYYNRGFKKEVEINYTEFLEQLDSSNVKTALLVEKDVSGEFVKPIKKTVDNVTRPYQNYKLHLPFDDPSLLQKLVAKGCR